MTKGADPPPAKALDRYYASSASDRTDDWPFWFVADRNVGGINRTAELMDALGWQRRPGAVLTDRATAEVLAVDAKALEP